MGGLSKSMLHTLQRTEIPVVVEVGDNWLARIFDDELDLDVADAFEIFGALELPTDVVPVRAPTRAQPMSPRSFAPTSLRLCVECGHVHEVGEHIGYRNAA
jgi:hypothetical protein